MNGVMIGLSAYCVTMLLLWLFTRKDQKVEKHWRQPFGIFFRMAVLFTFLHLILIALPFEIWQSYSVIIFIIAFSFLPQLIDVDLMAVIIIFWLIYQWAFWFPVKDEVILKNEPKKKKKTSVDGLPTNAVASTDLKPMGKIMIEGKEYTAISTLGFVNRGDRVLIEGTNGSELQVRRERIC